MKLAFWGAHDECILCLVTREHNIYKTTQIFKESLKASV